MTRRSTIVLAVLCTVSLVVRIATAQSSDLVLLDNVETADTGTEDAPDVGPDTREADTGSSIEIVGISDTLEPAAPRAPDPRRVLADAITRHARNCVSRSIEPSDANVEFTYLVRKGHDNATLTAVTNDAPLHVSKLQIEVLRKVDDTRLINIEVPQRRFRECIREVPLPVLPTVSEHLSFRIKAGALILVVHDVSWAPL